MRSHITLSLPADGESEREKRFRGVKVDEAIAAAVQRILVERGYDGLTFDAIAREAGVSRPTLYRRWPNRSALLEELTYANGEPLPSGVGTGNLRMAISDILGSVVARYTEAWVRPATLGLIASASVSDPYPTAAVQDAEIKARENFSALVQDAKAKGLMRQNVDAEAIYDLVIGPILYRTLFSCLDPISPQHIDYLLDVILEGVSAESPLRKSEMSVSA